MIDDENNCAPGPCGPTPANDPVCDPYACTIAAGIQAAVDAAGRLNATLGLRPYQVFLVWQTRDRTSRLWKEHARLELMPVQLLGLDELSLLVGEGGQYKDGVVELLEVSPQQVDERTLCGYRDGQPWAEADSHREFFYEAVRRQRCPGDAGPIRHRFILASPPFHDAEAWCWRIKLKPQQVERSEDGKDLSLVKGTKRPEVAT